MNYCGAFTYVGEPEPPYSVEQVIDFYLQCGFDQGISVDHVILAFVPDARDAEIPPELRQRQQLTLTLASEFLAQQQKRRLPFQPLGVAQGWSPSSYAHAVAELQRMGYDYIALGGMVPLKTPEIFDCLRAVANVRLPQTKLHLLGVTRTDGWADFATLGVASFDSTTPLRQAFKDDKDNYYTLDPLRPTWPAIRVPQVDGNAKMQRCLLAGFIGQEQADALEQGCLQALRRFDQGQADIEQVMTLLLRYEEIFHLCEEKLRPPGSRPAPKKKSRAAEIRATLAAAPWQRCPCEVCRDLRHHVILFRGAERNRRRGFHNIWVFYQRLQCGLGRGAP